MKEAIILASGLSLGYSKTELIIKSAHFKILEQDFVFITGVSGSGKSTLLKSMYGNLAVKEGLLQVCGVKLHLHSKQEINKLRRKIGIIFQDYKLIKEWNVERNIMFPMIINGYSKQQCKIKTERLLSHVKLTHKAKKYPLELSGGEQQRVSMARALAHNPLIIFADEPTGNLDDYSSDMVWNLLKGVNEQLHISIVVVTHRMPGTMGINYRHLDIKNGYVHEMA